MKHLIKLQNEDNILVSCELTNFYDPEKIYVPLYGDRKINDYVYKNTFLNNYIISVSGKIINLSKVIYDGSLINTLVIDNDYLEEVNTNNFKEVNTLDDLNYLLDKNNLIKLKNKLNKGNYKNFVVTCIDEEACISTECTIMCNYYKEILDIIDKLSIMLNFKSVTVASKNTSSESIKNIKSNIGMYPNIRVKLVPDKYLISRKEFLTKYLNIDLETSLVLNTKELFYLYNLFKFNVLNEVVISVSGNALKKGVNLKVKIGVCLEEIIEKYLEILDSDYEIFVNGLIGGKKANANNIIVTPYTTNFVINKKNTVKSLSCINCGACQKICPYNINTLKCLKENLKSKKCIGCGLCNYICPAILDIRGKVEDSI